MHALQPRVEPFEDERPVGVAVDLGHVAAAAAFELVREYLEEDGRSAAELDNLRGSAVRLCSDRQRRRPGPLRDEQEGVAAGQAAERPELVAGDEDEAGPDPAALQLRERPAGGIGLVGEPDLDVLGVARHAGIGKPGSARRPRAPTSTASPRPASPAPRRRSCTAASSSPIRAFGGSAHSGSGIRSILRRFSRCETTSARDTATAKLGDGLRGGRVERRVLRRCRLPPVDQLEPVRARRVDLGAAVDAEVETPRAGRPRAQLPVDVADVRAGDHDQVKAERAQLLDQRPQLARVGAPVGNRGAVPVEDDSLETAVERGR